jgi:membrane-bound serine protease (ClpP class)
MALMGSLGARRPLVRAAVTGCLAALVVSAGSAFAQEDTTRIVDVVEVTGVIDPPVEGYLRGNLRDAQSEGVHALIVQLDTPGGLDISMRAIIQEMLDSDVPVVVWVAPRGARAASAGTFIAYAANLAYMAESTELGAATPINLSGSSSETLERKVTNDAAAFIQGLARTRGRNIEWAEKAVRDAAAIDATTAARIGVVDGVESTLRDLLEELDGRSVEVADGSNVTLETWDDAAGAPSVTLRFQNMNLVEQVLHAVTSSEIAYLLLLIGAFGIIFELYNPGIGLGGILGAVALLLGFYALSVLPTNWVGVLLILLAVVFLVVDLHVAGLGVWTVGGLVALVSGGLLLFSGAPEALRLSPWAIVTAVALALLFFISVMTAALRVRLRRPITGEEGIIGMVGEAKTDIAPEGTVMTKGALWRARTMETGIAAGSRVRVMATEGLVLLVEPDHGGD